MTTYLAELPAFHIGPNFFKISERSSPRHGAGSTSPSQMASDEERNPILPETFEEYIANDDNLDRPLLLKCLLEHVERDHGRDRVFRPRLGVEYQADLRGLSGDGTISPSFTCKFLCS